MTPKKIFAWILTYIICILIIVYLIYVIIKIFVKIKNLLFPTHKKYTQFGPQIRTDLDTRNYAEEQEIIPQSENTETYVASYVSSYQPRYLLTINEKQQFRKLKAWAATHDAIVFTKVRVLDLIEPRKGIENYKSLFYKIQAKHVDFVICDQEIRVRCIIELDDNSHNNQKREERDNFLREALSGAGYKVLHTRYITPEFLNQL